MTDAFPGDLIAFLTARIAERVGLTAAIEEDADLFELGLDSIDAVEITGDIEEGWGVKLDPEFLFEHRTIARLVEGLAKLLPR
jgi:acyl carrier protein